MSDKAILQRLWCHKSQAGNKPISDADSDLSDVSGLLPGILFTWSRTGEICGSRLTCRLQYVWSSDEVMECVAAERDELVDELSDGWQGNEGLVAGNEGIEKVEMSEEESSTLGLSEVRGGVAVALPVLVVVDSFIDVDDWDTCSFLSAESSLALALG